MTNINSIEIQMLRRVYEYAHMTESKDSEGRTTDRFIKWLYETHGIRYPKTNGRKPKNLFI